MTQDLSEWDEDLEASIDQEYTALLRAIRWAKGFGLLFVQCSPAEGERLMERIQKDVGGKQFNRLGLDESVTDLYELLQSQPEMDQTDVLFLTGLDKSLIEYMEPGPKRTYTAQDFYAEDNVPRLLGQLNLQREILKETYPLCFVFLMPRYVIKYLVRKAPDFFDWRTGVWEFVAQKEEILEKTHRFFEESGLQYYLNWTPKQRRERFLQIDDIIDEGTHSDEEIVRLRIQQGQIRFIDNYFYAAVTAYDAALSIQPDLFGILNNKGLSLSMLGRDEDAIAVYDSALAIKPDYYHCLLNKGQSLFTLGQYAAAIAACSAALEIRPDSPTALSCKGNALAASKHYEEAIEYYDAALGLKPDDYRVLYAKGKVLAASGNYEDAIASYEEVLKFRRDLVPVWYERGNALAALRHDEDAVSSYDAALALQYENPRIWNNRGNSLVVLGNYEEALSSYKNALKQDPKNSQFWCNLGSLLDDLARCEDALNAYESALQYTPGYHRALSLRCVTLLQMERYHDVLDCFEQLKEFADEIDWNSRGIALNNLERYQEAIESYDMAIKQCPTNHDIWTNRGNLFRDMGDFEAALESYQKALQCNQRDFKAWSGRGLVLLKMGHPTDALSAWDEALKINPDDFGAWQNRGIALTNLGKYEEAIISFDKALDLSLNGSRTGIFYSKASTYALWNQPNKAIVFLQKAIECSPQECCEFAKTDIDFDSLRNDPRFQTLIQTPSQKS